MNPLDKAGLKIEPGDRSKPSVLGFPDRIVVIG